MYPDTAGRRLAAILSADVVGYSRLMADDEAATIRTLTGHRDVVAALVRQHRGRVVDTAGDNLLAEFPAAADAVQCAVEVQRVIGARNDPVPAHRRMEFRIGVHLGDIRAEGDRIYGDGVNIAARLEALAQPGGVCISATVHEQVRHRLDLGFTDLGSQKLKNLPDPVRVYRVGGQAAGPPRPRWRFPLAATGLLALAAGGLLLWRAPGPPSELAVDPAFLVPGFGEVPAIAVLAFDNLSGDPDQEYFADGIAEDLITRLSTWGRLPVIARNSSFTYKGQPVDVKRVGRELGARYVVEGSVRRSAERVRASVQLIDSAGGQHLWAETYDREMRELFDVQDEIVTAILGALPGALWRAEQERARRKPTEDLTAYELSMRAWWHLARLTREDNRRARDLFQQAIQRDPEYADAFAGLALAHGQGVTLLGTPLTPETAAALEHAARAAVSLDPGSSAAHRALGMFHTVTGATTEALAAYRRALELDPNDFLSQDAVGVILTQLGRYDEGIAALDAAIRLNPRGRMMYARLFFRGWADFAAGRYEGACAWFERSRQQKPDFPLSARGLVACNAQLGRKEPAHRALRELERMQPGLTLTAIRSEVDAWMDPELAERYLAALEKAGMRQE